MFSGIATINFDEKKLETFTIFGHFSQFQYICTVYCVNHYKTTNNDREVQITEQICGKNHMQSIFLLRYSVWMIIPWIYNIQNQ